MKKALIIIDMQPYFDHNGVVDKIINACKKEVIKAIEKEMRIVFVEWVDVGATHIELRKLTENYDKLSIVTKDDNDGSQVIVNEIGKRYDCFRICGVYTGECVMETIEGLVDLCPNVNIEVVASAVNSFNNDTSIQRWALDKMKELPRTTVVH